MYELGYDPADQLTAAILKATDPTPVILKRYYYSYDPAGNRTAEQIDDAVTGATYNNMNQLVSQQAGGALVFKGTVSEPADMTVGGKPATVTADNRFEGQATVPSGTGQVVVAATDPSGNLRTNTYEVTQGTTSKTSTYDANGNMTSDGTRTYEWDAENRLVAIAQGSRRSEFAYDGSGIRVALVERDGGVVLTDRRFVLCGSAPCEERDGAGSVTRRFFAGGMQQGTTTLLFTGDHVGSIRDVTDGCGVLQARTTLTPMDAVPIRAAKSMSRRGSPACPRTLRVGSRLPDTAPTTRPLVGGCRWTLQGE